MLERINLFPKIQAIWEKRMKMRRLVQVVSVVALILCFTAVSLLLSYSLLLTREGNSIGEKIDTYEGKIRLFEPIESKQVFLKSKLKELAKILEVEKKPEEVLENLDVLSLDGINFSGLNYANGKLQINGKARNVLILDKFVKKLEEEGKNLFSQADFGSINRVADGNYTFNLVLQKKNNQ
ncbi:hypothetical protein ISS86_02545 [Candidatus Microgenomates bacterium]|nr:hypothetical protein [Candidatus Microgenomates bacterium]